MVHVKVTSPSGGVTVAQYVAVSPQVKARFGLIATMSILGVPTGTVFSQLISHVLRLTVRWSVNSAPVPAFTVTQRASGEVRSVPPVTAHVKVTVPLSGVTEAQ